MKFMAKQLQTGDLAKNSRLSLKIENKLTCLSETSRLFYHAFNSRFFNYKDYFKWLSTKKSLLINLSRDKMRI